MEGFSQLLKALAAVSWPAIVFYIIWAYRKQVGALIESAKSRKFTIEVGGQKLSMEEASQQQQNFIADLQKQLLELRRKVEGFAISPDVALAEAPPTPQTENSVLWVDDNPKNNSYFIELLQKRGYQVDLGQSTAESLKMIDRKSYRLIISDMGRTEDGHYNGDAGIDLLGELNRRNFTAPFIVFCSGQGVQRFREKVKALVAGPLRLRVQSFVQS